MSVLVETDDSIRAAGGFMLQIMPGASEEIIDAIEKRLGELPRVSTFKCCQMISLKALVPMVSFATATPSK